MTKVYHADLFGSRQYKYDFLESQDIFSIDWQEVNPSSPFYLFIPQNTDLLAEYNQYWKITNIMPINVLGFQSHRDNFAIDFDKEEIDKRIKEMLNQKISDQDFAKKYDLKDNRDWKLSEARQSLRSISEWENLITDCLYRPFDMRFCCFSTITMDYPRRELINHVFNKENLCLLSSRQQATIGYRHCWVTKEIPESCAISTTSREGNQVFPLYIYPNTENEQGNLFTVRSPNFDPQFLAEITSKLGKTPSPENIFYYIYAIFHSPTYRQRYGEFLKIDFPRLPLTSDKKLFDKLAKLGEELVKLHLMESKKLHKFITKYQGEGDHLVSEVTYKPEEQRVYINKDQYFLGITPEIWGFKIGGYQVLDKWLKDRKKANRNLSFEDILHYQKIVIALTETQKSMTEIDQTISQWPII